MKKWFTCLGNLSWENSTMIISLRDNFHIKVSKLLQSLVPGIKKKKSSIFNMVSLFYKISVQRCLLVTIISEYLKTHKKETDSIWSFLLKTQGFNLGIPHLPSLKVSTKMNNQEAPDYTIFYTQSKGTEVIKPFLINVSATLRYLSYNQSSLDELLQVKSQNKAVFSLL